MSGVPRCSAVGGGAYGRPWPVPAYSSATLAQPTRRNSTSRTCCQRECQRLTRHQKEKPTMHGVPPVTKNDLGRSIRHCSRVGVTFRLVSHWPIMHSLGERRCYV